VAEPKHSHDDHTRAVHRRIEELAARLLDLMPAGTTAPPQTSGVDAQTSLMMQVSIDLACLTDQPVEVVRPATDAQANALRTAVWTDVMEHPSRPAMRRICPHDPPAGQPLVAVLDLRWRFYGCAACVAVEIELHREQMPDDDHCDVCEQPSDRLRPQMLSWGGPAAWLGTYHACPACMDLTLYAAPGDQRGAFITANAAKRIGRNEPCPCGSGAKWKRCHGRPA
jgi:hypothetical protein